LKKLLVIIFLLIGFYGFSQTKRIKIIHADNTTSNPTYPGGTISFGNVFVEHEGATLRCDKAYIYQDIKLIKAMGNVILNQGDTIIQYSKYTDYDGIKKIATSWGDVFLKDALGGTIKDTSNVLKSKVGNYFLRNNKFQAFNKVDVVNKDGSTLISNHLDYYTDTGIAKLFGASTITNANNTIYTENGQHNSKTNISHFLKSSKIYYGDRTIEGDSLYYNKNIEFASATGKVIVIDSANNSVIKGGYAELYKLKDSVFIVDKAVAISSVENDSIYIHGDTIMIMGKVEDRVVKVFNHVKFFKSDIQGKCDSLVTNEKTGLTRLFTNPVMWAEGNQITGDVIHFISNIETEQLDSLKILGNGLMIQKDSSGYSQLKGKNMFGKFEKNKLKSLDVVGNSEVIFYLRDESQKLIGITTKQSSKNIFITINENEIESIDYIGKPDGKTYPPSEFEILPDQNKLLKGFIWREAERPLNKEAIFIHDEISVTPKQKTGINLEKQTSKIER
jgi:lipopolysaccharide export system protein LptA